MDEIVIKEKLTTIFRSVFNDDKLNIYNEMSAKDVENWDSLSHMLLISEIENSFSIKFKLKDLNKMRNVGEMIDMIISKL
jgi:acyl carrier protein